MKNEEGYPQSAKTILDTFLDEAQKGAGADSARRYLDNYLWGAMWRDIARFANAEPKLEVLLSLQASIKNKMQMAQEMNLDMSNSETAIGKIKKLYTVQEKQGDIR